jgi:hypothetical protein
MTIFGERGRAFEQTFVQDAEARFRALARRNRMLGLWAAEKIGLKSGEAESYIREAVNAVMVRDGEQRIREKIASDLARVSPYWTDGRLRQVMGAFMALAIEEIRAEVI